MEWPRHGSVSGAQPVIKRLIQSLIGWDGMSAAEQYLWKYRLAGRIAALLAPLPLPLHTLLRAYGSDKQMPGWHSYGRTYEALFRRWKYRRTTLLEIGIGGYRDSPGGRSLLAWRAYFPFGRIIGCDIVPKEMLAGGRCRIHRIDQSSADDLAMLRRQEGPFDIIIDDGSHFSRHQIFTFRTLFDALRDDGIYVVEDVQTSFWPGKVGAVEWDGAALGDPAFAQTCYGWFLDLAAYLNHAEFFDHDGLDAEKLALARQIRRIAFEHNLIIVWKGANRDVSVHMRRAPARAGACP